MPSLKHFRTKIQSVKSMHRITSAMKAVAQARLRKSYELFNKSRPYAELCREIVVGSLDDVESSQKTPLVIGRKDPKTHLYILISTDRGLCGAINNLLFREVSESIEGQQKLQKQVYLWLVGKKAVSHFSRHMPDKILGSYGELCKPMPDNDLIRSMVESMLGLFYEGKYDSASLYYPSYVSMLSQPIVSREVVPLRLEAEEVDSVRGKRFYEVESERRDILSGMMEENIKAQIVSYILEAYAAEQSARINAMDNASKNALELIEDLTLQYNRTRQAMVTKELIEIVSGAEAV